MPLYNYICEDCHSKSRLEIGRDLDDLELEELCLFETSHTMHASGQELLEAKTCPRCNGVNCVKHYHGTNIISYVRGNGYLDKAGMKRDMNLFHLTQDDPYGSFRVPGEVDDIKSKLKRSGQRNSNSKHFIVNNNEMQKSVEKAVFTKPKTD